MGANFCSRVFKAGSQQEAAEKAASIQAEEQHESGHGAYSGHLGTISGVDVLTQSFATAQDAQTWIEENHEKWEPPILAKTDKRLVGPRRVDVVMTTITFHRWAPWAAADDYVLLGWMPYPSTLFGTPHGKYRIHFAWLCSCPMPEPLAARRESTPGL